MESKTVEEAHNTNEQGWSYYSKMLKDTKTSMFLAGPLAILFFSFCFVLITGWTLYTWYILSFPLALATYLFYFSPLVLRGRYINALVTSLRINSDSIEVKTFKWYFFPSKYFKIMKYNLTLKENSGEIANFPANCKFSFSTEGKRHQLYLIRDFFDNWEKVMQQLSGEKNIEK